MKSNRIFFLFLIPSLSLVFYSFLIRKKTNDLFFDLEKKRQILQKLIDSEPDSPIQDSAPELKKESFDLMLKNCGITSFSFSSGKSEHNGTYVFDCEHNKLVSVIEELNCEFLPFYPADFFFQKKENVYSVKAQIVNKKRH